MEFISVPQICKNVYSYPFNDDRQHTAQQLSKKFW